MKNFIVTILCPNGVVQAQRIQAESARGAAEARIKLLSVCWNDSLIGSTVVVIEDNISHSCTHYVGENARFTLTLDPTGWII